MGTPNPNGLGPDFPYANGHMSKSVPHFQTHEKYAKKKHMVV